MPNEDYGDEEDGEGKEDEDDKKPKDKPIVPIFNKVPTFLFLPYRFKRFNCLEDKAPLDIGKLSILSKSVETDRILLLASRKWLLFNRLPDLMLWSVGLSVSFLLLLDLLLLIVPLLSNLPLFFDSLLCGLTVSDSRVKGAKLIRY